MTKVFQKWVRVKEVFISRKLNRWGRRFGFVSFYGVKNVTWLERELDQIYICGRKLYVNIPKYRRNQVGSRREDRRMQGVRYEEKQKEVWNHAKQRSKETWVEKNRSRSYAGVLKGEPHQEWKGPSLKSPYSTPPWLAKSAVGKLAGDMDFEKLEEELVKGGMSLVRARFLGDDLVLLSPVEGVAMEDVMKSNTAWFNNVFSSVRPWSEGSGASHRVVWVRCYGVPLHFWNVDCFTKVIGEMSKTATLVSVDELTLSWEVVEYARLKVRLENIGSAKLARKVKINRLMCSILIEEEFTGVVGRGNRANFGSDESSDSVSSSETYVEESALSMKNGRDREWPSRRTVRTGGWKGTTVVTMRWGKEISASRSQSFLLRRLVRKAGVVRVGVDPQL